MPEDCRTPKRHEIEAPQPKRLSPHLRILEVDFLKPTVRSPDARKTEEDGPRPSPNRDPDRA